MFYRGISLPSFLHSSPMCRDEVLLERQPEAGLIAQLYLAVDDSERRVVEVRPDLIRLGVRAR